MLGREPREDGIKSRYLLAQNSVHLLFRQTLINAPLYEVFEFNDSVCGSIEGECGMETATIRETNMQPVQSLYEPI
jgi:hypothetical protein